LNSSHIFVIVRKMSGSIGAKKKKSRVSQRSKNRWIGRQLWLNQAFFCDGRRGRVGDRDCDVGGNLQIAHVTEAVWVLLESQRQKDRWRREDELPQRPSAEARTQVRERK
jgi:hypothetical protein